jgi:RNA polymerase sigma-70 factor (ECF subfamily)
MVYARAGPEEATLNEVSKPVSEDAELVRRIRRGEDPAEETLVRRFQSGLQAIARVRGAGDLAPDLVQETFAVALVNLRRGDWRGEGPIAAYLVGILRHRVQRMRSGSPPLVSADGLDRIPSRGVDPLAAAERAELRERTREALGRLPARHREVLFRYYFEDEDVNAIARHLGIPRGTVLSRLHHARKKLKKRMNRSVLERH